MSSIFIQVQNPDAPCTCSDCDWTGPAKNLDMVASVEKRISAGEIVPAGECPECGALAHLDEPLARLAPGEIAIDRDLLRRLIGWAHNTEVDWQSGINDHTYEADLVGDLGKLSADMKAAETLLATPEPPQPVYVIGVEGGVVQGMSTNTLAGRMPRIIVCDWDTQGDEGVEIGDSRANVYEPHAVLEESFISDVLGAVDADEEA
jgi:hypothetical protein